MLEDHELNRQQNPLNHSHNSLMFQNHLRGLQGFQNEEDQIQENRQPLRSHQQSTQGADLREQVPHDLQNNPQIFMPGMDNGILMNDIHNFIPPQNQATTQQMSPNQMGWIPQVCEPQFQVSMVQETMEVIGREKMVLIQMFSQFAKELIKNSESGNPHIQQQALHLLLYQFTFLLPTPSLNNLMVESLKKGKIPTVGLESPQVELVEQIYTSPP